MASWKHRVCTALVLGVASVQAAFAVPTVTVSGPTTVTSGSSFAVDVLITGAVDLYAFQYTLTFSSPLLTSTGITEGTLLPPLSGTIFGTSGATGGTVAYTYDTLLGPIAGASGTGTLAHLTFSTSGTGTSAIMFSAAQFYDSSSNAIATTMLNGSVNVVAVPEPATYAMFAAGLAALGLAVRRRNLG